MFIFKLLCNTVQNTEYRPEVFVKQYQTNGIYFTETKQKCASSRKLLKSAKKQLVDENEDKILVTVCGCEAQV